jgi:hypothetical protein
MTPTCLDVIQCLSIELNFDVGDCRCIPYKELMGFFNVSYISSFGCAWQKSYGYIGLLVLSQWLVTMILALR